MEFHSVASVPGAAAVLWDLMLERSEENENNISFKMPTWQEHLNFIAKPPYVFWSLARVDMAFIGCVSVTQRNEIGVVLFKASRGKGYGRQILEKLLAEMAPLPAILGERPGCFVANINPENERSIRLFESLGFILIQQTYALEEEPCPSEK